MVTETGSPAEAQNVVAGGEREAIIFIPGIGRGWDDPSIEGVAKRMAVAIDRQSTTEKAKTRVETAEQEYGSGYKCKMFTITKSGGAAVAPPIDVYGLDYTDTLVENYAKRTLFTKISLLAVTLVLGFLRWIANIREPSKSLKEKVQLAYGMLIFFLLVVYLALLIAAVVASVSQVRKQAAAGTQAGAPAQPAVAAPQPAQTAATVRRALHSEASLLDAAGALDWVKKTFSPIGNFIARWFPNPWGVFKNNLWAAWDGVKGAWGYIKRYSGWFPPIIVLMAALGFVLPPEAKVKEKISLAATNYLCLIHYLNWGERSHAIGGKLEALLEYLVERDKGYKHIHIIGYSFGSIVALDNLFPPGREPAARFKRVETLVTIGCPFDLIRAYWPNYFTGRHAPAPDKPKWINVYSPIDVLSSNFVDKGNDDPDVKVGQSEVGIEVEGETRKPANVLFSQGGNMSLWVLDILTLMGFRAHALYWGEEFRGEITCFHEVVKKMYKEDSPLLS